MNCKKKIPLFVEERDIQCHTDMTKNMLQHNRSNFFYQKHFPKHEPSSFVRPKGILVNCIFFVPLFVEERDIQCHTVC